MHIIWIKIAIYMLSQWNTIHDTQEPNDTYIEHQGCNTIPNEKLFFLFVKVY